MKRRHVKLFTLIAFTAIVAPTAVAQQTYDSAPAAYNAGAKFINEGNLAAAREPLEAALKLAPDDAYRLKVNRTLLVTYRELPEIEPLQRAAEYIITHTEQTAERSLTRRTLLAFVHKRGKLADALTGYEAKLKQTPNDRTTLYILTEAYSTLSRNPARAAELFEKLTAIDEKLGKAPNPIEQAQRAKQLIESGMVKEGAQLYELIAPLDATLESWHLKEAAAAWLKAGDPQRALAAARKSAAGPGEKRNEQLTYFWHKGLADVFLDGGAAKESIPHYQQAMTLTKLDGYLKDCRERLAKAQAAN